MPLLTLTVAAQPMRHSAHASHASIGKREDSLLEMAAQAMAEAEEVGQVMNYICTPSLETTACIA